MPSGVSSRPKRGAVFPQPGDDRRIEAHQRERPGIGPGDLGHPRGEAQIAVEPALDLADERHAPADEREEGRERRDPLLRRPQRDGGERLHRHGIEPALRQRQPVEREIVKDDGLAIGGDLDVAFDGIGMIDRRRGGGKGIFEDGSWSRRAGRGGRWGGR